MEPVVKMQIHGGDIYRNKIHMDFSVNANPLGPQPEVIEAVQAAAADVCRYPDIYCEKLIQLLSSFEKVEKEQILCGNGAAELFFSAVLAVKPEKALVLSPTFSEYERALQVTDTQIFYYELKKEQEFQIREDFLEEITPELDLVFLCNPNNPTGQATPRGLLEKIAEKCRKCRVYLVLDECFLDFLDVPEDYEMRGCIGKYPNLLIVKALTKTFCMPGLRLGYAISGNEALLDRMRMAVQPWNVSVTAQAGGAAALLHGRDYLDRTKKMLKKEREFLIRELQMLGYSVYGSMANYIFFESAEEEESSLYQQALSAGILIRDCSGYRGLGRGYYRIAVRTRQENERMITWLKGL